ncbi:Aquaglycerol porin AQY3 [Pseudocercospora fuligena]|uniref:Aquaglycerol porin AQY3 n=1 Tax=Pseudocercospora fuligena TaxID=685502 RepID=A0A8H6RUE6_9PEZI|nr:Aquaglycerol porin AQY3 [Pseudocercospora fuligena]
MDSDGENKGHNRNRSRSEAIPVRRDEYLSPHPESEPSRSGPDQQSSSDGRAGQDEFGQPRRAATVAARDFRSPQRTTTALQPETSKHSSLRRRSTAASRRSQGAEARSSTAAGRSKLQTLAGPEITPQVEATYQPYVNPGYAELNPAYEQPANAKPVWSLAKPLPRVVRPGMVPTNSEIFQNRQQPQLPAENTQNIGVEADPNDLEAGRIQPAINPAKVSAQLKDSRAQREENFLSSQIGRRGTITGKLSTRPTRASSTASQTAGRGRATSRASQNQVSFEEPRRSHTQQEQDGKAGEELPPVSPGMERIPSAPDELGATPLEAIPEHHEPPTRPASLAEGEDDDVSQATLHEDEEPELWVDMDPIKLIDNPPLVNEVHNNHTWWSIVRTQHREFLAEFLATFVQLTTGFCADTQTTLNNNGNPNSTAWAWGFSTMIGIYISGGISGAHLNPAITLMLWFYRGFPKRKVPEYVLAQLLAAFLAAFVAYGLYLAGIQNYINTSSNTDPASDILNGFITSQRFTFVDTATAFFNEFLGTAFLGCTVLALGDDQNAPPGAGMNSLIIGLVITGLNLSFVYNTGLAMNPTRDLGPRLAMLALGYGKELFTNPYWFYGPIVAPVLGAFAGGALYDIAIFTGGESPINYPWTRTKRSYRKGKAKWKRRLHLAKRDPIEDTHWVDTTR